MRVTWNISSRPSPAASVSASPSLQLFSGAPSEKSLKQLQK